MTTRDSKYRPMIEPTRDNLYLHWHETDKGWYYYVKGKSDNRFRFGTGRIEDRKSANYQRAVDAALPLAYSYYLDEMQDATRELPKTDDAPTDDKCLTQPTESETWDAWDKKQVWSNVKVCKLSDATPLDAAIRWQNDPQTPDGLDHMTLLVGEKACYKVDLNAYYNLNRDTAEDILLTVETASELTRQRMATLKPKAQKAYIEYRCRSLHLPIPKYLGDYPATWEKIYKVQATVEGVLALLFDGMIGDGIEQPPEQLEPQ
jgi:hypothetical protein